MGKGEEGGGMQLNEQISEPVAAVDEGPRVRWKHVVDHDIPYRPVDAEDRAAALRWLRKHGPRRNVWIWHVERFLWARWNAWCDACVDADDQGQPRPPREPLSDLLAREWSAALVWRHGCEVGPGAT